MLFEFGDALVMEVDGGEVVFEDEMVCGVGKPEMAEVAQVSFGPMGFAIVFVAKASEEGEEARLCATKIVDGIGASAT